ncbi:MAG: dTDP-4-dehydrorhamnose reductase [Pseudomonadota bacterium]
MTAPLKILVAGSTGQVAQSLVEAASLRENIALSAMGRPTLDITQAGSITSALDAIQPDLIINAAAYTAVDKAETERKAAYLVNETGPRLLAEAAREASIPLVHLSTDYVFNGQGKEPYKESDPVDPLGIYGSSKFAGEEAVRTTHTHHLILRTAWVYGVYGGNFLKTMLRVAENRDELGVVADQRGAPTSSHDIAEALLDLASAVTGNDPTQAWGTYHMTAQGDAVWADFAEAIFSASVRRDGPSAQVNRITTDNYPTPAARPAYSVLDCSALEQTFGIALPHWEASVASVVSRILNEKV